LTPKKSSAINRKSLAIYVFLGVALLFSHFVLKIQWEQNIRTALEYYNEFSCCFAFLMLLLIPFRLDSVRRKGIAPETRKVRFFGPIIDLSLAPFYDVSLFYSGLFMLHIIFRERPQGLSLDPFLILALVAAILVYQSLNGAYKLGREIFFVETTEKMIKQEQ